MTLPDPEPEKVNKPQPTLRRVEAIPPGFKSTERGFFIYARDGRCVFSVDYDTGKIESAGDAAENAKVMVDFFRNAWAAERAKAQ